MIDLKKGTRGAAYSQAPRQTVQQIVLFWLSVCPQGYTRRELSKNADIEIATLCAALKALENKGAVVVLSTTICPTTGREVAVYTRKGETC